MAARTAGEKKMANSKACREGARTAESVRSREISAALDEDDDLISEE